MKSLQREYSVEYEALGDIIFLSEPLREETEITGPAAAKLFIPSSTDADLFLALRAFTPGMREVRFHHYLDPHTPLPQDGCMPHTESQIPS